MKNFINKFFLPFAMFVLVVSFTVSFTCGCAPSQKIATEADRAEAAATKAEEAAARAEKAATKAERSFSKSLEK